MSIQHLIQTELDQLENVAAELREAHGGPSIDQIRSTVHVIESVSSSLRTLLLGVETEGTDDAESFLDTLGESQEEGSDDQQ